MLYWSYQQVKSKTKWKWSSPHSKYLCLKGRCYKEGAQHAFDTFLHCCSHSQMFSYHHVTYFCSNLSLGISPQKIANRSDVLLAFNWNNSTWLCHWTRKGGINFFCVQMLQHMLLADSKPTDFWKIPFWCICWLVNGPCSSKVLVSKNSEKLLPNTLFWELPVYSASNL